MQWEVSISDENQIYKTISCNGKAMNKAMGREQSQIMIWDEIEDIK
jgi:hypothetical protein